MCSSGTPYLSVFVLSTVMRLSAYGSTSPNGWSST